MFIKYYLQIFTYYCFYCVACQIKFPWFIIFNHSNCIIKYNFFYQNFGNNYFIILFIKHYVKIYKLSVFDIYYYFILLY